MSLYEIHTLFFPCFDHTWSFHDVVDPHNWADPHGLVVSYLLTHILRSSSQNQSIWSIPFRCHVRCGGMLMIGCLPSGSTDSPHRDQVNLEMHSEGVIKQVWRCTWRSWSSGFGDTLVGCDRVSVEMHLEVVIKRVWRCTWRPWSSEIGGVLGDGQSESGSAGGRRDLSGNCIHHLTSNWGNVEHWVQHGLPWNERLTARGWQSMVGWCSTRCMQYSVYAALGVNCCSWHGEIERDNSTLC